MAMNKVPFQAGLSMAPFMTQSGTEAKVTASGAPRTLAAKIPLPELHRASALALLSRGTYLPSVPRSPSPDDAAGRHVVQVTPLSHLLHHDVTAGIAGIGSIRGVHNKDVIRPSGYPRQRRIHLIA